MEEQANSPTSMEREDEWITDVLNRLRETTPISSGWSICKVPRRLRSVNEDAYTPHFVSIGPIHHEDKQLLAMEDHKRLYLLSLFNRTQQPHEQMLKDCCHTITGLDKMVRDCYAEPIPYDKNKLAEILLHDAGFLLELFFRYTEWKYLRIPQNDPIFTTSWMLLTLRRDLALLENQIPFFVLEYLFKHIPPHVADRFPALEQLALQIFKFTLNISRQKGDHLLHLLYNCHLPPNPVDLMEKWESIHCATSLDQAGVEFQKNTTNGLFDFQFHNGIFKIPRLPIYDSTDSLLRNLVAFEQSLPNRKHYITSYIVLMDYLINTTKDVDLLQHKRIIANHLGGGGDVSCMFKNIGKHIVVRDFYFAGLCSQVNEYAKSPWHRYKVALRRDYFKNPWSITSFVAAITLLFLTFLQTLYSILS